MYQIVGLGLSLVAFFLIRSVLPSSEASLVAGGAEGWKKFIKGAAIGVLIFPIILLTVWIVGVAMLLFSSEPKSPQLSLELFFNIPPAGMMFWAMVAVAVVLAPYVEEMLFRGFLQGFLYGLIHPALSVLATSAAFAAVHYSSFQKGSNVEIMAGLFLFAIIASNLREREDSIYASIAYHAAFNATSLALAFWQK